MRQLICLAVLLVIGSPVLAQASNADPAPPHGVSGRTAATASEHLPEHELLRSLAGDWLYIVETVKPGAPAMRTGGTATIRAIMGGRIMELRTRATVPEGLESLVLMGYDARSTNREYFMLGVDSLGHQTVDLHGSWDSESEALVMTGREFDPVTGREVACRQRFRFVGSDMMTCDIHMTAPGSTDGVPVARVVYQRLGEVGSAGDASSRTAGAPAGADDSRSMGVARHIERMKRAELMRNLDAITGARSLPELEAALRGEMDERVRGMLQKISPERPESPTARAAGPGTKGGAAVEVPNFGDEMIRDMSPAEARAALTQIITARRIPGLTADQRSELSGAFTKILESLRRSVGEGAAGETLQSIETEQRRENRGD